MPSSRHVRRTDRVVAGGLAVAAFGGVVALVAVRGAEPAGADVGEPRTEEGLTRTDLDDYARQLAAERARLAAYREELREAAARLGDETSLEGIGVDTEWSPSETPDTTTYGS